MFEWGFWETDACPCCDQPDETTTHFPFCDHLDMMATYTKHITEFVEWMSEADTDPCIATFFTATLRQRQFPVVSALPKAMDKAELAQRLIGWDNILFGRLATEWMILQHNYLATRRSRQSAERWAADMTYCLLQLSHSLWMTRNGILHERDQQGLLLKDGLTLQDAITTSYN
jgi:hypothetical protein